MGKQCLTIPLVASKWCKDMYLFTIIVILMQILLTKFIYDICNTDV